MADKPGDSQDLSSLLGAGPYAMLRHQSGASLLSKVIDELVGKPVPDSSNKIGHATYLQARDHLSKLTALAAIAGDSRLDRFVGQWTGLQVHYAKQVIAGIKTGIEEQKERLETCDLELKDGERERQAYNAIKSQGLDKKWYRELENRMRELDTIAKEREQLSRAVAGISKAEQTLTTLIESGISAIHYRILSVEETQEQLGRNEYTGPLFEPMLVSNKAENAVKDIFMRTTAAPSLRRQDIEATLQFTNEDLPDILRELVVIYEYVRLQQPGTIINPSKFRPQLGLEALGAKGIGSYFEDSANANVFGVTRRETKGSRTFVRQDTGMQLDKQAFLKYMTDGKLQGPDARVVNEFYFRKVLGIMRERPEAYTGFTKEHLAAIASNKGYPLSTMYIARHVNNHSMRWELEYTRQPEGQTPAEVRFAKIEPTATQIELCREAADSYGTARFVVGGRDDELVRRVHELHQDSFVSPAVTANVMERNAGDWGYRIASKHPLQYQKSDTSGQPSHPESKPIERTGGATKKREQLM